ncbi:MAG: Hvo_1808 family surface protein [Halobacteriales archaeon]
MLVTAGCLGIADTDDRLGREDGYWYNESVPVDRSDGLNETELDAVVSRAMARIEKIRGLEFKQRVPVNVISREQFASNQTGGETQTRNRLHQNAKWEAMFMINESTNAIETQQSNQAASVSGYYSPSREEIVIVSENTTSPKMDEITLSQELFHALQDRKFDLQDLSWYPGQTEEEHNAADGVIEGDGNYVDYLYEQRCENEWDCLLPESSGGGGGGAPDINIGLLQVTLQPYSDGPGLVQSLHEQEGWEAVNDLYENPPASTEQVIHPEKYGEDEPSYPTVEDTASNGWEVLEMGDGAINYASFGEGGLAVMMWYPSFVASDRTDSPQNVIVPYADHFNFQKGSTQLRPINQYNYDFPVTDGWDGDRLVPYVNGSSAETNETGYVWKINWDSEQDATEFTEGYTQLLDYHGAQAVDSRENTYRIPEGNGFADAFHIQQDGNTVTIVNAPTVDDLGDVHGSAGE